jgi:hypothetical protein
MNTEAHAFFLAPGDGETFPAFGEEVIFHLTGAQTEGVFTLWAEITPPGGGPPLHYHDDEGELFLVEKGRVAFINENQQHDLGSSGVAFLRR